MSNSAAFIGLGNMGSAMAGNLLKHGVKVSVYNRSKDKTAELVNAGAVLLNTPADAFKQADVVFSMLANDQAVQEVTEGSIGLLSNVRPGCVHVSMSTISPALARSLADKHRAKGVAFLSAPVFGRPEAAAQQALWICLSGEREAKQKAEPLLKFIGQKIYDFGDDPGAALAVKLAGNFMILSSIELMAEAFAFVQKSGIDVEKMHNFLSETLFPSPVFKNYGKIIRERKFSPAGFKMTLGLKDIDLFLRTADKLRVALPIAGVLHDRLMNCLAHKREELDWSAIALVAIEEAGLSSSSTTKY